MVKAVHLYFFLVLTSALCLAQESVFSSGKAIDPSDRTPVFGTTVVATTGLIGQIFYIPSGTASLPNFKKLKPIGTVYTTRLNITPRGFTEGFPGVTDRFEWFAIQYTGKLWVEKPGKYDFAIISDDGSKLQIDEKTVIDNDGQHPPTMEKGSIKLSAGVHRVKISYFQGPRTSIALMLAVIRPGEEWRIFDTKDFMPPPDKFDEFSDAPENKKK